MPSHSHFIQHDFTALESQAADKSRAQEGRGSRDVEEWVRGDRSSDSRKSSGSNRLAQTHNRGRTSAGLSLSVSWSGNRNVLHESLPCSKYQVDRLLQFTSGIAQRRVRQRQRFASQQIRLRHIAQRCGQTSTGFIQCRSRSNRPRKIQNFPEAHPVFPLVRRFVNQHEFLQFKSDSHLRYSTNLVARRNFQLNNWSTEYA